jgi:hypothetical protein
LAKAIALLELADPARPWFIERLRAIIAIAIFASKISANSRRPLS